jgi:bla regulator protein blaR1
VGRSELLYRRNLVLNESAPAGVFLLMRTVALLIAMAILALGQKFEVASIKPTAKPGYLSIDFLPGGRFSAKSITVHMLLRNAYGVQDYQVVGGPGWTASDGFDIEAKAVADAGDVSHEQVLKMIQALLADRFQLVVHRETRQLPVYNLVTAKNGATMKVADSSAEIARTMKMGELVTKKMSMTMLANLLVYELDRPVVDATGLKGDYAFTLQYTRGLGESDAGPAERPSLFTAVQDQLGLRLESAKGPVEVLVIDHVEKPSEN